ncbi:MAG: ABC transporter ATP-binding protein/permease [Bacilli bacterium]|nr:ABC transporter ATP-binding protein/permease [Bacilli bacterium]
MLEIKNISKIYKTNELSQKALNKVSINFRKCEFVSILGPSGSGKTTLLNVIGGLDHYDSGDLIINEISTKKYKDKDWDSYRNHRIGFVFQSYNLIGHQSVLKNVELALTLSGVSKKERMRRAKDALKSVGLKEHMKKLPNQLSGGQMQRVAIARALVNNPDILLADEPTGALDSETSKQIMELLKHVANEKLVIMVTHNPDLALEYSTRIIKLRDGEVIDDSNPYDGSENTKNEKVIENQKTKKTSMSLLTALSLSLNNLMTKLGRTILTSFAGSIGIIGIALILSLSNGVQEYIDKTEKETLASYPLSIESNTMDLSSMMNGNNNFRVEDKQTCKSDSICTYDDITNGIELTYENSLIKNNLKKFKSSLDANYSNINKYTTDIGYSYDLELQIYSENNVQVNPNNLKIVERDTTMENGFTITRSNPSVFNELIDDDDLFNGQYDLLYGRFPTNYNELVLIVDEDNSIPLRLMYTLDIENRDEIKDIVSNSLDDSDYKLDSINYKYESIVGHKFKLLLNTDYYKKENGKWLNLQNDENYLKDKINDAIELSIVGIYKVNNTATDTESGFIGYKDSLVEYVIDKIKETDIAKEQIENNDYDIITNIPFNELYTKEMALEKLGIFDIDNPSSILIYPKDYDSKEKIIDIIDKYNKEVDDQDAIIYVDYVGTLMSGITTIINIITYVLIAFVAISLVVSSIMIAIITYISVLERTKEIGILRAIGASKKDVTRVFKAETIIEGFVAGVFGILTTIVLCIPINIIVQGLTNVNNIAKLPPVGGIVLIIISVLLTLIAGLIPSRLASRKDPVVALRTE